MARLYDLAQVIRSKNAGPLQLTLDIIFADQAVFDRVLASGAINAQNISHLYDVPSEGVQIIPYKAVYAIKITMPRKVISGDILDDDIYGCQQHLPLADLQVFSEEERE